ncbi:exopolysaccharide biosynthesis polyprenyl glycosylphosphotransferase [Patescibacteria group bacterium]
MSIMNIANKKEPLILLLGDIALLYASLFLMLVLRYGSAPGQDLWAVHFSAFSIIFVIWIVVFFIAGLYEKHTLLLKHRLPTLILNAQAINSVLAIAFFYFIPYFAIAPKTNLFIQLIISFIAISLWRIYGTQFVDAKKKQKAILIGSGEEMHNLYKEINNNPRYSLEFVSSVDLDKLEGIDFEEEIISKVYSEEITTVVMDLKHENIGPILPKLYNLIFSGVHFLDKYKVYEDVFDRIPLSLIGYNWFLENISSSSHVAYDSMKRLMDILISSILMIFSILVCPFVYIAIKLDDKGPIFFVAERIGKNNTPIKLLKFRTMSVGSKGGGIEDSPQVTRVGAFLRKARIDEIPQLWNVWKGDISLVGPRPETPALVKVYEEEVPYYAVRHLIKPGLSGWAQMYHEAHPHHGADVDETKNKLSYDLFYIKNRSIVLDLKIALKTVKTLLSRSGV